MQPGDVYETQARVDRLREVTAYSPRVSIETGIQRFVDWYLGEYLPLGLVESLALSNLERIPVQGVYGDVVQNARQG